MVKLHFKSGFHLSKGNGDYSDSSGFIQSDTMIASLVSALAEVGTSEEELMHLQENIALSSTFPFSAEELFFPKLFQKIPFKNWNEKDTEFLKKLKKIKFVSQEIFESIINGKLLEKDQIRFSGNNNFLSSREVHSKIFSSVIQERVSIDEDEADSVPFDFERVFFDRKCGLFFLFNANDEKTKKLFLTGLRIVADEGLGSGKHHGNGAFEFEMLETILDIPNQADFQICLSMFCPKRDEAENIDWANSNYSLIKRGGIITSMSQHYGNFRKKAVFMVQPGSCLKSEMKLGGKIIDLRSGNHPSHAIWRSGKSLFFNLKSHG